MGAPCKNCGKREVGCHSTCEAYITFSKEMEELKKKRRLENIGTLRSASCRNHFPTHKFRRNHYGPDKYYNDAD